MNILSISITYIILSLPYFLEKKLNLNLNYVSKKIYKFLFIVGVFNLLLFVVSLFYKNVIINSLSGLSIIVIAAFTLKTLSDWKISEEIMDKFDKMK